MSGKRRRDVVTGPVRIGSTNLDYVTPEKKDLDHLDHLVDHLYATPLADGRKIAGLVLLTQETKNFRLVAVLRAVGQLLGKFKLPRPMVMQGHGQAKAGTAIAAYGVHLQRVRMFLGGVSRATLPRWVTRGRLQMVGGVLALLSVHVFPPRTGWPSQERYLRKVRRHLARAERRGREWVVGGDFNHDISVVAKILGGHIVPGATHGGIGLIVSDGVRVLRHGRDTYGERHGETDHPAVWVDVELKAAV